MRLKISCLLPAVIVLCSFTGINNSLNDNNLQGRVKSVTEYAYYNVNGQDEVYSKRVYQYDVHGNETADTNYLHDGSVSAVRWSYKYNSDGIKNEEIIYKQDGSISWRTMFTYDTNGRIAATHRYHSDGGLEERLVYHCDASGNNTTLESYNTNGALNYKGINTFDEQGRKVEALEKAENSALSDYKTSYAYDSSRHLLSITVIASGDQEVTQILYNGFDNNGNPTEEKRIHNYRGTGNTYYSKLEYSYY